MAQEQAKENSSPKIALVDTRIFADEKEGILIYVKASTDIDNEFKPLENEFKAIGEKINKLANEIRELSAKCTLACPEKSLEEKLNCEKQLVATLESKAELVRASYKKRVDEVLKPIEQDIDKELKEFVLKRGYKVVFDLNTLMSSLGNSGISLYPSKEAMILMGTLMQEFIVYYNSKHPVTNSQYQVKLSEPK